MHVSGFALYHYRGVVVRVVDGDGLEVSIDLGMRIVHTVRIRLAGINAPELHGPDRPAALDATSFLGQLVDGRTLVLRTHKDGRSFDRYVADAFVVDSSGELHSVADALVDAGHATRVPA